MAPSCFQMGKILKDFTGRMGRGGREAEEGYGSEYMANSCYCPAEVNATW